jgi:putative tryptophan/tyrosine transport system substrate-binding protein
VRKRVSGLALNALLLALSFPAEAQQAEKIFRIGFLIAPSASYISYRVGAFRQRLREHGYVEGNNIVIEYRYAEGRLDRLPQLAAELVGLKVDVIVTAGPSNRPAMKATSTIPIVTAGSSDPVGDGLVSSLARPGGNITGLSLRFPELDRKRLELLREAFPKVARVALLWASGTERRTPALIDVEAQAKALRLELLSLEVRSLDELESALARAKREGAQALIATSDPRINMQLRQILEFAEKNRLPAIYATSEFVEAGGLMSYGPNYRDMFRRAADFVDKILKGTKPADIPFEQPTRLEFVINLRTAEQIGVTIPPQVLMWADQVIK